MTGHKQSRTAHTHGAPRRGDAAARAVFSRLYRDPDNGILSGVCAGVADYLGIDRGLVRIGAVAGFVLFPPVVAVGYVVMAFALPRRPPRLYADEAEARFWRDVRTEPELTVRGLGQRFRDLERRLRAIETVVTSPAYRMDAELDRHRPR